MSVVSRRLPRKSNLVIAQAAAMPKTALAGTVSAATSSVSQIAERASGALIASTVRLPSVPQRFDEDEREGDEQEDEQKCERHRRQRDANEQGLGQPGSRLAGELGGRHLAAPPPEIRSWRPVRRSAKRGGGLAVGGAQSGGQDPRQRAASRQPLLISRSIDASVPSRFALQPWSALRTSSSTNDRIRSTNAIAAAPA